MNNNSKSFHIKKQVFAILSTLLCTSKKNV